MRVTRDGGIWEIVLDRPKANAISIAVSRELSGVFCSFRDDPDARIAILTGGGERFFSAGWDLKAAAAGEEDTAASSLIDGGFAGLTELWSLDKPVIAAVNGMAAGGGFELALAADMIVASENAECWLPEAQIGILPDGGGVVRLQRRIPRSMAVEMMMTGRRMSAEEGHRWGLISRVVPQADLMDAARELAHAVAKSAPLSLRAIKAVGQRHGRPFRRGGLCLHALRPHSAVSCVSRFRGRDRRPEKFRRAPRSCLEGTVEWRPNGCHCSPAGWTGSRSRPPSR